MQKFEELQPWHWADMDMSLAQLHLKKRNTFDIRLTKTAILKRFFRRSVPGGLQTCVRGLLTDVGESTWGEEQLGFEHFELRDFFEKKIHEVFDVVLYRIYTFYVH